MLLTALMPAESARLAVREPDQLEQITLNGQMQPYHCHNIYHAEIGMMMSLQY